MNKNRCRYLGVLVVLLLSVLPMRGEYWRMHNTRGLFTDRIVDTPDYTYFLTLVEEYVPGFGSNDTKRGILYRYEKQNDETHRLGKRYKLSDNLISEIAYNPEGRYLAIGYLSGNIDILYDNGKLLNITGLRDAGAEYPKKINSIHCSTAAHRIYVATDFGFIEIDDQNGTVIRTHRLGKVSAVTRFGDKLLVGIGESLFTAPLDTPLRTELLTRILTTYGVHRFLPLGDSRMIMWSGSQTTLSKISYLQCFDGVEIREVAALDSWVRGAELMDNKVLVLNSSNQLVIDQNFVGEWITVPPGDNLKSMGCWNGADFWIADGENGFNRKKMTKDEGGNYSWTVTKLLNTSLTAFPFWATHMAYHPQYGMLVRNAGTTPYFDCLGDVNNDLLSSFKDYEWKGVSAWLTSGRTPEFVQGYPIGTVIDPLEPQHVYSGSVLHGLLRTNLSDPKSSLRIGRENDPANGMPGFVPLLPAPDSWDIAGAISEPAFDSNGNMWVVHTNPDGKDTNDGVSLWCWTPEARLASKDAATFRAPVRGLLPNAENSYYCRIIPIMLKGYENILLYSGARYCNGVMLIDTKGTADDFSDDSYVQINTFTDQDGETVTFSNINAVYQDSAIKRVWVGTDVGVFWFEPKELMTKGMVHRIKISRNDGTNLADYLLDNTTITNIIKAPDGNLWFATCGGGLVCASGDGSRVIRSYTVANSEIPDNNVYALCYNPDTHSMMVSTDQGLASLFLNKVVSSEVNTQLKCYPNPVRPDFYGYVTVEGLPQNALVKVLDSRGNLVKELDPANAGETRWDVTDMWMKRVQSGVYYIVASGGDSESSFSASAKILVVN